MQEFIFTSSILILAVALLRLVLGRHIPARARYALWLVVLLRLAVPFSPVESSASAANLLQMAGPVPAAPAFLAAPAAPDPQGEAANGGGGIAAPQAPAAPSAPARPALPENAPYLIWALGSLAAGGWMLAENLRFAKKLRAGRLPLDGAGLFVGQGTAGDALPCPLPVWRCGKLASPCLFGVLRPAVYLNEAACESAGARGWAVRHEWQHYRHGDHLWCLVRCVCLAVYWWHPLVWLAAALSRRDCELACDEGVTAALGSEARLAYGRCLLALAPARGTARPGPLAATGMSENARQLKSRLSAITSAHKPALWAAVAALAAAIVLAVTTLTGAADGPELMRDARAALDMLRGSITVRDGILGFTLPETGFGPEEWSIHVSGSARTEDGQRSLHFMEEETDWQGGRWYPITEEGSIYNGITELWLNAALPGETGEVRIRADLLEYAVEFSARRAARLSAALPEGEEVWLDFALGEDALVYSYLTAGGMPNDEDAVHGHVYLVRESGGIEQLDPLVDAGGRLVDELGEGSGYFAWYPLWVNEGQRVLFGWQVPAGSGMSTRLWTLENGSAKELDCPAEQLIWLWGNEFTGTRSAWDAIRDEDGSTGHTQKVYWLYWDEESGALREYGGTAITEADLWELARRGGSENEQLLRKILDTIRAEGGVLGDIWLRGNGVVNINYRIPLDETGTAWANHNISLASDEQRSLGMIALKDMSPGGLESELLAVSDQGGVYEAAGWPEIAVYLTALEN